MHFWIISTAWISFVKIGLLHADGTKLVVTIHTPWGTTVNPLTVVS